MENSCEEHLEFKLQMFNIWAKRSSSDRKYTYPHFFCIRTAFVILLSTFNLKVVQILTFDYFA